MAFKFEIVDTHFLRITDDSIADPIESMVVDMPKADAYYDHRLLKVRTDPQRSEHVYIYDKNDTSTEGAKMFKQPLSDCVDDTGAPFTKLSFVAWMRLNTGFNTGSGGSGSKVWDYTATNYTDLTTNVAPTANEGEIALVYNSQGIWAINRRLKGLWIYQSGLWQYANEEIQTILQNKVDSVNGKFGTDLILNPDDLDDSITAHKFASVAELAQIVTNQTNITTLTNSKVSSVTGTAVDNTDPLNPIVNLPTSSSKFYQSLKSDEKPPLAGQAFEALCNQQANSLED